MTQIRIPYFTCTEEAQKYGRENAGDDEIKKALMTKREVCNFQSEALESVFDKIPNALLRIPYLTLMGEVAVRGQFLREALEAWDEATKIKEGR